MGLCDHFTSSKSDALCLGGGGNRRFYKQSLRETQQLFLTTNKRNSYKILRLWRFPPFSRNTCKSQGYFVTILKMLLLFCKKLQWNCGCCVFTRFYLRVHPVSFSADAAAPCSLLGSDWHLWPCSYLGGCGWSRGQGPAAPAHGHGSCPALFTRPHPPLHSEQGSVCLQNVKHIVREEAQSCILVMFFIYFIPPVFREDCLVPQSACPLLLLVVSWPCCTVHKLIC